MSDIVEKLEDRARHPSTLALREDAAQEIRRLRDEIERYRDRLHDVACIAEDRKIDIDALEVEVKRLRAALREIADTYATTGAEDESAEMAAIAREALGETSIRHRD